MVLEKKRWDILHRFEGRYKQEFLRRLNEKDSLRIFYDLYSFGIKLTEKNHFKKINTQRIKALSNIHSMFMKVG
jgi:hypothetical protein